MSAYSHHYKAPIKVVWGYFQSFVDTSGLNLRFWTKTESMSETAEHYIS